MIINKSVLMSLIVSMTLTSACGTDTISISKRTAVSQTDTSDTLEKILSVYGIEEAKKADILNLTARLEKSLETEDQEKLELVKSELEKFNISKLNLDEEINLVSFNMAQNPLEAFIEFLLKLLGLDRNPNPRPDPKPLPRPLPRPEPAPEPAPEPSGDNCRVDAALNSEGTGPHSVAKMSLGRDVTIHYPSDIADSNCLHGVIAWGNGTGRSGGSNYMQTFRKWASFGFVVAVHHSGSSGSGGPHKSALSAILGEADKANSPFYKRLNPKAAISGQSQGGLGTSAGSSDDRFVTAVPMAGASKGASKPSLFLTSQSDFMKSGTSSAYNSHSGAGTLLIAKGTSHASVPFHKGMLNVSVAWYRCFLNKNEDACNLVKDDCSICSSQSDLSQFKTKNW